MSSYEDQIWSKLKYYISNEYGIAGLMGNLQAESGLIPYRLQGDFSTGYTESLQYTNDVNLRTKSRTSFATDGKGYGLAQWTSSNRKYNLYDSVSLSTYGIGELDRQIPFMIYELEHSYSSVWNVLNFCTSIREASDAVLHDFENPREQGPTVEAYRESLGQAIYNNQHGIPPTPPPTPPPVTPGGVPPIWLLINTKRRKI